MKWFTFIAILLLPLAAVAHPNDRSRLSSAVGADGVASSDIILGDFNIRLNVGAKICFDDDASCDDYIIAETDGRIRFYSEAGLVYQVGFGAAMTIFDSVQLRFGSGGDTWQTFDGTSWTLNSTDIDGGGTDGVLIKHTPGDAYLHLDLETNSGRLTLDADADTYITAGGADDTIELYTGTGLRLDITDDRSFFSRPVHMADGIGVRVGTDTAFFFSYDEATDNAYEFSGTSCDGLGTDCDLISIPLGADDITYGGDKGVTTTSNFNVERLTFAADPGDASLTTVGLIPDGSFLLGVTTRVITAGTNCATIDIGDGVVADLFASAASVADAATTDNTDSTAGLSNPQIDPEEVTITGNIACFDLVIDVTAHFWSIGAQTSD